MNTILSNISKKRFFIPTLIGLTSLSLLLSVFAIVRKPKQDNIKFIRLGYVMNIARRENINTIEELFAVQNQEIEDLSKDKEKLEKAGQKRGLTRKEERKLARIEKKIKKLNEIYSKEATEKFTELYIASCQSLIRATEELRKEKKYPCIFIEQGQTRISSFVGDPRHDVSDIILAKMGIKVDKEKD